MLKSLANLGVNDFFLQDIPTRHLRLNIDKSYFFLKRIILDKNIDTVFCPAYEGGHQDHDVTNFIVSKLKAYCKTFEFPDHHFFTEDELNHLKKMASDNNLYIITTEKYFVRIPEEKRKGIECLKVKIKLSNMDEFMQKLVN